MCDVSSWGRRGRRERGSKYGCYNVVYTLYFHVTLWTEGPAIWKDLLTWYVKIYSENSRFNLNQCKSFTILHSFSDNFQHVVLIIMWYYLLSLLILTQKPIGNPYPCKMLFLYSISKPIPHPVIVKTHTDWFYYFNNMRFPWKEHSKF